MTKAEAAPPVVLDLSDLINLDTIEHNVLRNGEPSGWVWTLADVAHPNVLKFRDEQERRALKKAAAIAAQTANGRKVKPEEITPDEQRRELTESVASRVLDFSPVKLPLPEFPGVTEYNPAMAVRVLSHPKLSWVLNDIINRITDDRAFMKVSANS